MYNSVIQTFPPLQAHMIKYKAELLNRCDSITAENVFLRESTEKIESRLNCVENALPDTVWEVTLTLNVRTSFTNCPEQPSL